MFLAEIVAIEAEERLFEESGRLALEKIGMVAYAHGEYFSLGEKLGSFGYSVRKKKPAAKPMPSKPQKKPEQSRSFAKKDRPASRKSGHKKPVHKKSGKQFPGKGGSR